MFGKKQSGTSPKTPAKSASVSSKKKEKGKSVDETVKPNSVSTDTGAVDKSSGDDMAGMLDGLDDALASSSDPAPAASNAASQKGGGDEDKKPLKDMDTDTLLDESGGEEEVIQTAGDTVSDLRLQRCQKRIWLDLRDGIDLKALARMDGTAAREEIFSAVEEISRFRNLDLTPVELENIGKECANDMLGFGPLEELLERDDIADIMINGPDVTYIEVDGKIERTHVHFRDNQHLTTICQRIVGAIGRRVDESSPICDARLADGSRVNVIIPPLAVDGACMTIRKFKKDKLTLENLMEWGSMSPSCAKLIMAIGRCRVNVLVSGGTGSGKTTMLNCLTRYIEPGERVVTCEDACELQLQQPHVVRLETRPPNLEGVGEITMRDLVKNCLRMRPERIIVGEVRGPEAFDLLQAMNTGHDGSMGTVHANNPREAVSRMENMIAMGGLNLPTIAVREQIASAVHVIIQVQRLRDGSRKTTHVTEITGMEGEVVTMQDLFTLDILGEDENGKLITKQKSSGLRPKFFDNARQYGVADMVMDAMEEAYG
ncbi:MAG: protein kinase [Alphaproteobacteria bacterium]|nr:MAG: protein kinase [Alphaproteobacteria bacterium]